MVNDRYCEIKEEANKIFWRRVCYGLGALGIIFGAYGIVNKCSKENAVKEETTFQDVYDVMTNEQFEVREGKYLQDRWGNQVYPRSESCVER